MTVEQFIETMESTEENFMDFAGCKALAGLNIIKKYLPDAGIDSVGHDIIFASGEIEELIAKGITKEDIQKLAELNWMVEDYYLACFV